MANTTISALPAATAVAGADLIPVVQGGVTKQAAVSLLPTGSAYTDEQVQDVVAAMVRAGTNVTSWVYDDTAGTLTLNVAAGGSGGAPLIETVNTVAASGAALTLPDVTTATIHDVTLTANCTLTFPTATAGKSFLLRLTQDATGSRTVTWPAGLKWPAAAVPTLSTAAGAQDLFSFLSISGTTWNGLVSGLDLR